MSSLVLCVGSAAFFSIMIACMAMRRRGACAEALWAGWASGLCCIGLLIAAAAMLKPSGTPEEEALWLCYRSAACDMVRFAEAIKP